MGKALERGLVIRVTGNEVWVDVSGSRLPCKLRGRFRQLGRGFQVVAGDRVMVRRGGSGDGVIEGVLPRESWLSRYVPGLDKPEKVIVANIATLFLVVSVKAPPIHYGFVDRVLVAAERGMARACICLNKMDLAEGPEVGAFKDIYNACGYEVLPMSALTGEGVGELERRIGGGVYAFVGESGVGKSSLLMRIDEGLDLRVGDLAAKTGRGRHTTSFSQLYPIRRGYVADTPGMQSFAFPADEKEQVAACFPEMRGLEESCRFRPCTHSHEPGCAVKEAWKQGRVKPSRYRSYLDILAEVEARSRRRKGR